MYNYLSILLYYQSFFCSSGKVIGRQKVDLKICACPLRDYRADEKLCNTETNTVSIPKRKIKRANQDTAGNLFKNILVCFCFSKIMELILFYLI